MSVDVRIRDSGNSFAAKVEQEGTIQVVNHGHAPTSETIFSVPFRQYFTDDGTSGGDNDMIVDGSTNAVDFYVTSDADKDTYIVTVSVDLSDGGSPNMNKFGDLSALTNGLEVLYITQDQGEIVAFLADASGGGTEKAYLPKIDVIEQFGLPFGIKLRKGTTDRLVFRVRDALAGLLVFNIIAYGNRLVENN
jgi:hypothetical protein